MAFSSKDLALLLPDEVDTVSMRHTKDADAQDKFEAPKPRVDLTKKVTRYFPGKAPEWADSDAAGRAHVGATLVSDAASAPPDRRLARLARVAAASSGTETIYGRRRYEAVVVEESFREPEQAFDLNETDRATEGEDTIELLSAAGNGEDDIAERRRRIKERLAAAGMPTVAAAPAVTEEESDSEYETDSSDESSEEDERMLMRPMFVPKFRRQTIADKEAKEEEESLKLSQAKLDGEERKRATHVLVAESVRRQEEIENLSQQAATDVDSDSGLPDDVDDDEEVEYQEWKLREMARIKRDAEARIEDVMEKAELERRRSMTADERFAEDLKNGRFDKKDKAKWGYLQKYYHKGVFYMDYNSVKDNDVRKKDYYEPTLEDRFNKEALPAVMQVKNFGKRGRTKYTHLLDQDTTQSSAPTLQKEKKIMSEQKNPVIETYMKKRGGMGDVEKPFTKKFRKL